MTYPPAPPPANGPAHPGEPYPGRGPYQDQPYQGQPYQGQPYAQQPYGAQPYEQSPGGRFYPSAPPPYEAPPAGPPPAEIKPVIGLLLANLGLSILLTVLVLIFHRSVVDYRFAHSDTSRVHDDTARSAYENALWTRVALNLFASVIYVFIVRALLQGRRWAYRRVLWISVAGMIGLAVSFVTPYPIWVRVEQGLQILVLAALLYFVTRPEVRAHCVQRGRRFSR